MQEKKPFKYFQVSYEVTRDAIVRSDRGILDYENDRVSCDLGLSIGRYFDWKVEDAGTEEIPTEKHTIGVVAITLEEFERLKEYEWMYKDLSDEGDDE